MNPILKEDLIRLTGNDLDWEKFKQKTFLVTGAYGMLAQYMIHALMHLNSISSALDIKVIALVRNVDKARRVFRSYSDDSCFRIMGGDVAAELNIEEDVHYILHAASPANSQAISSDPISVISANVFGTRNLLELARRGRCDGFLFFSSGEVCGSVDAEFITETDAGLLDPTETENCYGESKRIAEMMCACWHRQHGVPTVCVRPDHTYGPTMDLEGDPRVFASFVSSIVRNQDIVITSDGMATRTFCYLADAADGFFRALLIGARGESYNVSNNDCHISVGDLAEMLVDLFPERGLRVAFQNQSGAPGGHPAMGRRRPYLSTKKIEALGYGARYGIKEGFYRTIQSFQP